MLSVQLIRVTTLQVGTGQTQFETLLGGGVIFRVEERETEKYMFGSVTCSRSGESSWRVTSAGVGVRFKNPIASHVPSLTISSVCYTCQSITAQRPTVSGGYTAHLFV